MKLWFGEALGMVVCIYTPCPLQSGGIVFEWFQLADARADGARSDFISPTAANSGLEGDRRR